jgi:hypothetical protein
MLDLRLPTGALFALLGVLLLTASGARAPLTPFPVNFYCGMAMLVFAAVMLWLARKSFGR